MKEKREKSLELGAGKPTKATFGNAVAAAFSKILNFFFY